jgi:DNA-directed RNA polymerase sigma subunit (sigma70/sigma32)
MDTIPQVRVSQTKIYRDSTETIPLTQRQIGHTLGLSSEGVRLIERHTLGKLRQVVRERQL